MQRVLSLIIQIQVEEKLIKRDIFIKPHLNYIFISLAVSSVSNVHAANLSRALFDGVPLESLNSVANEFEFTSDGSQIVFSADFNQDDFFELYAVNVDGSRPRQLSSSSFQMEDDNDFQLAPNGNYVIFRTQDISSGEQGLFGVSLLSDNPTRVNLVPVEGEPNRRLRGSGVISQDSQHIVVTTAASALSPDNRFFAISVNGDIGNQPLSLSQSTLIHSHDSFFGPELTSGTFTPDGDYITSYFAGVFGGAGSAEVFRLSMSGGPAIQLSDDDLPPSSFDGIIFVDLSSDGQFLLYRRIINGSLHIARTNTAESSMQISPDDEMVIGISVIGGVPSFSRDARSIVFDSSTDDVSLGGNFTTSKTLITNPLFPAGGNTSAIPNFVTPDSVSTDALAFSDNNDVYYLASTNNEQQLTLFNGANPVSFIPQGGAFSFIRSHMHSDDGDISVFVASNQFTGGIDQVYVHDRQNSPGEIVRITDTQQANTVLQTNGIMICLAVLLTAYS